MVVLVVCVDYVCLLVLLVGYSWFGLVNGVVWYVGRWFVNSVVFEFLVDVMCYCVFVVLLVFIAASCAFLVGGCFNCGLWVGWIALRWWFARFTGVLWLFVLLLVSVLFWWVSVCYLWVEVYWFGVGLGFSVLMRGYCFLVWWLWLPVWVCG